jgi:RNA polymerase sigma factor (sigma-70 family)
MPWTQSGPATKRRRIVEPSYAPAEWDPRYAKFVHRIDGVDADARVIGNIGKNKSHQWLYERACPGPADRSHKANFDGEKLYWSRWDHARRCFGDNRRNGKIYCAPDFTHEQAAGQLANDTTMRWVVLLVHLFGLRPVKRRHTDDIATDVRSLALPKRLPRESEPEGFGEQVFDLSAIADCFDGELTPLLGFFLLWLVAGMGRQRQLKTIQTFERGLAPFHHVPRLTERKERELAKMAHDGDVEAGNILIASHTWICRALAKRFKGRNDLRDLEQEGTFGLYKALREYDPVGGSRFDTFAWKAVGWSIRDYLRKQRRLERHMSTNEIAEKGGDRALGLYARNSVEPDSEHKLISRLFEKTT